MKKVLCAFGNTALSKSFFRFYQQAEKMNVYDDVYIYSTKDLDKNFQQKFNKYLIPFSRGFGCWVWKPQVILQTLRMMEDGDLLQYTDLGCHLNPEGRKRLLEYFDIVKESNSGILAFRAQKEPYNTSLEELYYPEYEWTKGDLLDYFGIRDDKSYTHSIQFGAGIIFIRKDKNTVAFFEEFLKVYEDDFHLGSNKPSVSSNLEGFLEHREDQSIFSILCKKYKVEELSSAEYYASDWSILKEYPIHVKRDLKYRFKYEKYFNVRYLCYRIKSKLQ